MARHTERKEPPMLLAVGAWALDHTQMWDHDGWDGAGWMWLWGTLMMALWVGVIVWVVWLVTRRTGTSGTPRADRAEEILRERYARGEIDAAEYRERLEGLR